MFRKMRRFKQQLSKDECIELLNQAPRGVLSVHGEDGYPYGFPMNYIYLDGKVYFHSARQGHKIDALESDNRVSFCVMDKGFRKAGEWALNIKSVIIFGRITAVTAPERVLDVVRQLGMKYYPTAEEVEAEIKKAISSLRLLELSIDHMTGKLVNES